MKAKSLLLTVPLAVSALLSLSLPANAVCWSWKPCADYQGGYGYGAPPTESQSVLPPLAPGSAPPPGSQAGQQGATGTPSPAGAPEKLTPKKPEATAKAAPAPAPAKPKPAPAPAQAKAAPPPAPAPVQAKAAPMPQPAPVPAQAKAVPPPAPQPQPAPAPVPAQAKAAPAPAPAQAAKPAPAPAAAPASAPGMTTVPGTATMQVIPE
jgi:outer membrane biosynthesis protein TonB